MLKCENFVETDKKNQESIEKLNKEKENNKELLKKMRFLNSWMFFLILRVK